MSTLSVLPDKPLTGSFRCVAAGDRLKRQLEPVCAGQLYTWGRGHDGQLGQTEFRFPKDCCALPRPVLSLTSVVHVACGGGDHGCTAAVTSDGRVYTFGSNYGGRLGHGQGESDIHVPKLVDRLSGVHTTHVACGLAHMLSLDASGRVYSWGRPTNGCLGNISKSVKVGKAEVHLPKPVDDVASGKSSHVNSKEPYKRISAHQSPTLVNVIGIDACDHVSAAVLSDGRLVMWGSNDNGELGMGDHTHRYAPAEVNGLPFIHFVSVGSRYTGACTNYGELFTWGYGGSGNLGHGDRRNRSTPRRVEGSIELEYMVYVSCSRNQYTQCIAGQKKNAVNGRTGLHTVALSIYGEMYSWGAAYGGALGNVAFKSRGIGKPWDELSPYKLGGDLHRPSVTDAVVPEGAVSPPYSKIGPSCFCVASNSMTITGTSEGKCYAWGNAGRFGQGGVARFLMKSGRAKKARVDRDNCFLAQPHRVGLAGSGKIWDGGTSLRGKRVHFAAAGKHHAAAICTPAISLDLLDTPGILISDSVTIPKQAWDNATFHSDASKPPNARRERKQTDDSDWWQVESKLMQIERQMKESGSKSSP